MSTYGIPQWSIDFWNEKREKLDEITTLAKEVGYCGEGDIGKVIERLEKFRDEEL